MNSNAPGVKGRAEKSAWAKRGPLADRSRQKAPPARVAGVVRQRAGQHGMGKIRTEHRCFGETLA
jgi:hypothetical protein